MEQIKQEEIIQEVPALYPIVAGFEVITQTSEEWKEIRSVIEDAQDRLSTLIEDGAIRPVLEGEKFFSIEEVCSMLGCSLTTVNKLVRDGNLDALTLGRGGRKRIVKESALIKLLDSKADFKGV